MIKRGLSSLYPSDLPSKEIVEISPCWINHYRLFDNGLHLWMSPSAMREDGYQCRHILHYLHHMDAPLLFGELSRFPFHEWSFSPFDPTVAKGSSTRATKYFGLYVMECLIKLSDDETQFTIRTV